MILPLILAATLGADEPIPETPRAQMEQLYARYSDPSFNPLTHLDLYFAPKLAAAMEEDSRLAEDEIGYLDGDPVCQCQDPAGLHAVVANERMIGIDQAEVRVSISLAGYEPKPATFRLMRTKAAGGSRTYRPLTKRACCVPSKSRTVRNARRNSRQPGLQRSTA